MKNTVVHDPKAPLRIVVLQRGWVAIGRYHENGEIHSLSNAAIIRVWGTSKGLGEIAFDGPTKDTILDPIPPMTFHVLTTLFTVECDESKWKNF